MRRLIAALALFVAVPASAQQAASGVTAIKPGQVQIVFTYVNANGKVVADTTTLTVLPIAVASINLYNQINPPRWISNIAVGKSFCAYAEARDTTGQLILTGRPVVFKSTDTTVAKIVPSAACPDTTVDMSKINVVPNPPGAQSLLVMRPR